MFWKLASKSAGNGSSPCMRAKLGCICNMTVSRINIMLAHPWMDRIEKKPFQFLFAFLIFLVALLFRLQSYYAAPEKIRGGMGPFGDTIIYQKLAYNLYKGNGFSAQRADYVFGRPEAAIEFKPAITRAPVYPFFMSLVFALWGDPEAMKSPATWYVNWDRIRYVQCFFDSTICILFFFLMQVLYPRKPLLPHLASVLYCFSLYNQYYTRELLTESLATFLMTLFFALLCLAVIRQKAWILYPTGLMLGILILCKQELIVFLLLVGVIPSIPKVSKKNMVAGCLIISGALTVILPWTLRNYMTTGKLIPVAAGSIGFSLFVGTFEGDYGRRGWGKLPKEIFSNEEEHKNAEKLIEHVVYEQNQGSLKMKDYDDHLFSMALDRILTHPFSQTLTWLKNFPRLWYQNYFNRYYRSEPGNLLFIFYLIFLITAFLLSSKSDRKPLILITCIFAFHSLIYLPLHIEARYSVPVIPLLNLACAIGLWQFLRFIVNRFKRTDPPHLL